MELWANSHGKMTGEFLFQHHVTHRRRPRRSLAGTGQLQVSDDSDSQKYEALQGDKWVLEVDRLVPTGLLVTRAEEVALSRAVPVKISASPLIRVRPDPARRRVRPPHGGASADPRSGTTRARILYPGHCWRP